MKNWLNVALLCFLTGLVSGAVCGQSLVSIPQANKAPVIDGILSPQEWNKAAVTSGFKVLGLGTPAEAPVVAYICYNNYALFVGWECKGEPMDKLIGKLGERDSPVWTDSSVELFLSSPNWPKQKYAHFLVNYLGTIADETCAEMKFDTTWNPDWQVKTGKTQDSYTVEMAIPWAALDITPKTGLQIRGNLTRNTATLVSGASEASTWAKMSGGLGFHQPDRFGTLILAGNQTVAQVNQMPERKKGKIEASAKLTQPQDRYMLSMTSLRGNARKGSTVKSLFSNGLATVTQEIGFGTNDVVVQVKNPDAEVIWSQDVNMAIPDVSGKLARINAEIKKLSKVRQTMSKKYGENSQVVAMVDRTIDETKSDVQRIEARSAAELSVDELTNLMNEMDLPLGRSTNIVSAVEFAEYQGRTKGTMPRFFVTNPVSTQKIMPTAGESGPSAKVLSISMMKNEFEPVQIVVCPIDSPLENVEVKASNLVGPNGTIIPADRLLVTPIVPVKCKVQTPGAVYRGLVPDVLLPYKPMNIWRDVRQPYFITVHTLAADTPGEYTGKVTVSVSGSDSVDIPMKVKVYDVTLPVKSSLRTVFLLDWAFGSFTDGLSVLDARINYSKTMLEHRLTASSAVYPTRRTDGSWDFSDLEKYISELVPLGQTTLKVPGEVESLKATADYMKKRGVWDLHYLYGWDEAAPNVVDQLQTMYREYVNAVPDVKVMQTGWNPNPKLKGLVRIWCPLTASADMKSIRQAQAEGDEVWWYVCCGPTAPYANLFVDYPGIDHRILGWQTYQYGITGFLYWGLDVWQYAGNNLPLDDYIRENYANWNPQSFSNFNGDGYLCYPGKKGTAVPSMRLALLRDGFEDCDLLNEAKALSKKAGKAGSKLEKLIKIGAPISKSLTEFTSDGNLLLQRREQIMQEMEKLQKTVK